MEREHQRASRDTRAHVRTSEHEVLVWCSFGAQHGAHKILSHACMLMPSNQNNTADEQTKREADDDSFTVGVPENPVDTSLCRGATATLSEQHARVRACLVACLAAPPTRPGSRNHV
jgi:hypothetical protein